MAEGEVVSRRSWDVIDQTTIAGERDTDKWLDNLDERELKKLIYK